MFSSDRCAFLHPLLSVPQQQCASALSAPSMVQLAFSRLAADIGELSVLVYPLPHWQDCVLTSVPAEKCRHPPVSGEQYTVQLGMFMTCFFEWLRSPCILATLLQPA